MNAIQQKCRPKHQVLILKCYPRTTKGAVDVKPNSSELSYLLFYATSRRSKIQKVGQFLEKKTASDVWRVRIGYVRRFRYNTTPRYSCVFGFVIIRNLNWVGDNLLIHTNRCV